MEPQELYLEQIYAFFLSFFLSGTQKQRYLASATTGTWKIKKFRLAGGVWYKVGKGRSPFFYLPDPCRCRGGNRDGNKKQNAEHQRALESSWEELRVRKQTIDHKLIKKRLETGVQKDRDLANIIEEDLQSVSS